jgi:hypothetical protein
LAEQYEVIQRWINGANSTRQGSMLADPIAGVPQPGGSVFRFIHNGAAQSVPLAAAEAPIVSLDWTLYAFAPSITAIASLKDPPPKHTATGADRLKIGRRMIERLRDPGLRDTGLSAAVWEAIRHDHDGVLPCPLGLLVGSPERVMELLKDRGERYSVCGYDERFAKSVGQLYLGFDGDDPRYAEQAPAGNQAIGAVTSEYAFDRAYGATRSCIDAFIPDKPTLVPVDALANAIMAPLCRHYFGIPDDMEIHEGGPHWRAPADRDGPRCPGDCYTPTQYVFDPIPSDARGKLGQLHGQALRQAALRMMATNRRPRGIIADGLASNAPYDGNPELFARSLIGILIGFVPVTFGNIVNVARRWIASREIFRVQQEWLEADDPVPLLTEHIAKAMKVSPVPDFIWRTAREDHDFAGHRVEQGTKLLICIESATQAQLRAGGARNVDLVFGGRRGSDGPVHACPGYAMGMGTIQGFFAALLDGATIRLIDDPLALELAPSGRSLDRRTRAFPSS